MTLNRGSSCKRETTKQNRPKHWGKLPNCQTAMSASGAADHAQNRKRALQSAVTSQVKHLQYPRLENEWPAKLLLQSEPPLSRRELNYCKEGQKKGGTLSSHLGPTVSNRSGTSSPERKLPLSAHQISGNLPRHTIYFSKLQSTHHTTLSPHYACKLASESK